MDLSGDSILAICSCAGASLVLIAIGVFFFRDVRKLKSGNYHPSSDSGSGIFFSADSSSADDGGFFGGDSTSDGGGDSGGGGDGGGGE